MKQRVKALNSEIRQTHPRKLPRITVLYCIHRVPTPSPLLYV
jgi:hypothetical protein